MVNNLPGTNNAELQAAIGILADEAYTNAKKLSGTGIMVPNSDINTDTETYIGQLRFNKTIVPVINNGTLTDATDGTTSDYGQAALKYVKAVRAFGARQVNLEKVITQTDGLLKIGKDFAEIKAQDESDHLLAVLRGVMISELLNGAATASGAAGLGGQTFDNDPTDKKYGMYVDLGNAKLVVDATTAVQGAARAQSFLDALGMAYKDYEPAYMYLVVSPAVMSSLRAANLTDEVGVIEGNITFTTIFGGKFRLIVTRATQTLSSAQRIKVNTGVGVNVVGTQVSFLVAPGALGYAELMVPKDVEIYNNAASYHGTGTEEVWYRWGRVIHPAGYDWIGSEVAFQTNDNCIEVIESSTVKALTAVSNGTLANTTGVWNRKSTSALTLGILPIFHN